MIIACIVLAIIGLVGFNHLRKPKCIHCGSRDTKHGYSWTRGYNDLCKQATGDSGRLCNNCCKITWDRSLEEYQSSLPDWCYAYKDRV